MTINSSTVSGGRVYNSQGTITITNSSITGNSDGGGILNYGMLTLTTSTVAGNAGGGVLNLGALSLAKSTVSGNSGGGISNAGTLTLFNSTISDNSTGDLTYFGGGIDNDGELTLYNSTVTGNSAESGGGIWTVEGTLTLVDSTISGNSAEYDGGGIDGSYTAYNSIIAGIISAGDVDGQANPGSSHNLIGGDPRLAILGNYGGTTLTMPPLPGSPALDAGDNALARDANGNATGNDQRGGARIADGNGDGTATVDIGAVEGAEEMSLPTSLTVGTLRDEYNGNFAAKDLSLREAIAIANLRNENDVISFQSGLSGTIALASGELVARR